MATQGSIKKMIMKKMLVFVNFTEASMQAVKQASAFAKLHGAQMHICHISKIENDDEAQQKLKNYTDVVEEMGAEVSILAARGEFFSEALAITKRIAPDLVILGSVGEEGFSIAHFGSAVYKLVRSLPAASLVIQRNAPMAASGYRNAMLPLSTHGNFDRVVKSLAGVMARDGLVTILGVTVNNAELEEKFLSNATSAQNELDRVGIKWKFQTVGVSKISSGYAEIILAESMKEGMDLIAMPADVSKLSQHFGKMDKEALLSNSNGIPVLCLNTDMD